MKRIQDIQGRRFGSLVALEELPKRDGMRVWRLRCDCGREIETLQKNFCSGGNRRSCGHHPRKPSKHGLSNRIEYRTWINMISRCENPNTPGFNSYGGRGIQVCSEWRSSFEDFFAYVGQRPSSKHSLDRIDVNGNYEPGNVRWATSKQQCRNTRTNLLVTLGGETMTLAEAVERTKYKYNTVLYRIKRGKSPEEALR